MLPTTLGFLAGIILLQQCSVLPPAILSLSLFVLVPSLIKFRNLRVILAVICGFLWASLSAHTRLYPEFERKWEGTDLVLEGTIVSIPEQRDRAKRFIFEISRLKYDGDWKKFPRRVRLNWYTQAPALRLGQQWRLMARLKRPWSFKNPGGFDYEGWLFQKGIRATGYVRQSEAAQLLAESTITKPIGIMRQALATHITQALDADSNRGIVIALTIGERSAISAAQWSLLLNTGTNHLLAISGLHIGLIAGLAYFFVVRIWRFWGTLCRKWPAQRAAALLALLTGIGYALLAGFSVPTQRAVIMLCAVMGAVILDRNTHPMHTLAVALLAVLIWDPLAVLSSGFWLSFGAVIIILYSIHGRAHFKRPWWDLGRLQWILALGLLPLTLVMFHRVALIAPMANLIAVPVVGFFIVPITLMGSLVTPIIPSVGKIALGLSSELLDLLWMILDFLAGLPFAKWHHAPPSWTLWPSVLGIAVLLAPRGWPGRWLGVVLLLPLVFVIPKKPIRGEYFFTLLDVGQGLSAVIETRDHVLVYDTGARFSQYFNLGDAVVIPYLRSRGIDDIDVLMISHGDNDHIGGANAILKNITVQEIMTSVPDKLGQKPAVNCLAEQRWIWDDVIFEVLHPPAAWQHHGNNQSCVLRVQNNTGAVLLTADIEVAAERYLVENYGEALASDILLIPHHASTTSSSLPFLNAVEPELALLPLGYRNRFGFPNRDIIDRYHERGIRILDTLSQGAIRIDIHPHDGIDLLQGYRQQDKRYWSTSL